MNQKLIKVFFLITALLCVKNISIGKEYRIDPHQKYEYINIGFWERFNDPLLGRYILMAVENNHDARKASWQVEQYRQEVKKSFGKELPSLSVGSNYLGIHLPQSFANIGNNNAYILPFLVNWELDLLLKNRDKTKSVKKTYLAYGYDEQAIYISLATDVATAYVNLLQYDYLVELQKSYVESAAHILKRSDAKFIQGTVDAQTLYTDKQSLEDTKNKLHDYLKEREQVENQLAVLVGIAPGVELERNHLKELEYEDQIPEYISSDIVFSRPDVLAAESRLQGAKIDIRVARKEFLPRFNILGVLAFSTFGGGNFWSWESTVAFLMAGMTQDIFKGGQKIAELRLRKSVYEQMFEDYKQKDLNALKEVNDALYITKQDEITDKNTLEKLVVQEDDYRRSKHKFERGVISRPELISELQKLISMQQMKAQSKTTRIVNYFTLYKAVGGAL